MTFQRWRRTAHCIAVLLASISLAANAHGQVRRDSDWPAYGNDPGGMRHSALSQINRENVAKLKVAWVFHTGDISDGADGRKRSGFETTPIVVDGRLYLTTPFNRVIALDPNTGKQLWSHDPNVDQSLDYGDGLINRGVATWLDPSAAGDRACKRRIFEATLDARLIALDAATGRPCEDFGASGQVDLRNVPGYQRANLGEHMLGWYHMTSPPVTIDDMVIVGSAIDDNVRVDMPSGVVRAFDARSGALRWRWDPIAQNVPSTTSSWMTGAANAWSVMTVDLARDLVFIPTGSASPGYYGGLRPGDNKWANSVVALHARSGKLAWGFQLVHHDLWDYDTASAPLLATLLRAGQNVPVVIQGNKTGFLYVLDRDTGKPFFPVQERAVPQSDIPGEQASPTQPFPLLPPPLAPQHFSIEEAWGPTPSDREACKDTIGKLRNEGVFTPPSLQGTLAVPGNLGGMNWSGYAFDPIRKLLIVNTNNLIARVRLIPRDKVSSNNEVGNYGPQRGTPYAMLRRFLQSPSDLPCGAPPWGTLTAVDMVKGTIRWQIPFGSMNAFGGEHSSVPPGSISLGGPITTDGGLVFMAGTPDSHIRAFNVETGRELWSAALPAAGNATPMTYEMKGRQYLVVAAGGLQVIAEESLGDAVVAFALP
jgi:quinoprotein glucose dehydrogenase